MLQFNIDYTYIDLNANHFNIEGDGKNLYDSNAKLTYDGRDDYYFTPWNLEKYEFNYGMAVGPSIFLAPFTSLNAPAAHHIKLNLYYHIGYHASLLWMQNNEDADANQGKEEDDNKGRHEQMKENTKMDWGHGLIQSFGFSVTWKFIGIGYEHRSAGIKYQSVSTGDFGKDKYKFKSSTNRIFIQFKM
ncbi:MAG: hypothetical protein IJ633_09835 [Prevotella sp.]|nr:hypothetical protein [Prevotella sp.]